MDLCERTVLQIHLLLLLSSSLLHPKEIVPKNGHLDVNWLTQEPVTGFSTKYTEPTIITFHLWMTAYQFWGTGTHGRK